MVSLGLQQVLGLRVLTVLQERLVFQVQVVQALRAVHQQLQEQAVLQQVLVHQVQVLHQELQVRAVHQQLQEQAVLQV